MSHLHDEQFERISAYVDNELSAEEAAVCERDFFRDDDARDLYRELRSMRQFTSHTPEPQPMPLKLDLTLTGLAEAFLADEAIDDEDAANQDATPEDHPALDTTLELKLALAWLKRMRWRIALVACALFSTLAGMSFFAYQEGGVPTLSRVEQHVTGLPALGSEMLDNHLTFAHPDEPDYDTQTLAFLFKRQLKHDVPMPDALFGGPVDGRVIHLGDHPTPIVRYEDRSGPVSLFVVDSERALEEFGSPEANDRQREEDLKTCLIPSQERCFDDGRGTSLCLRRDGELTQIWVASMPSALLKASLQAQ